MNAEIIQIVYVNIVFYCYSTNRPESLHFAELHYIGQYCAPLYTSYIRIFSSRAGAKGTVG